MDLPLHPQKTYLISEKDCDLAEFRSVVETETTHKSVPHASEIVKNIPVYDSNDVRNTISDGDGRDRIITEWANVLLDGSGVIVLREAFTDEALIDEATDVFFRIIGQEQRTGLGSGDHFARPGANSRIWNAHEKLCVASPETFIRYSANDMIALASESWLGPAYQITAQVNAVHPGGEAQTPHRDYHMGFQAIEELRRYPAHIHRLSATLTLQGAVAHCDMPVESGPTKLLPYSQKYEAGYLAAQMPEFRACFEDKYVQMPLSKGDAVFFNPALFHAAGANITKDTVRIANLLQVGSAYGRSIETVDRSRMCAIAYPFLLHMFQSGSLSDAELERIAAATAEGYAFPTNLDRDPPIGGMAPQSQQALLLQAVREKWPEKRFREEIAVRDYRKLSN